MIELLVVMAIIGLLAALLLPAVQNAREASRRSACSSNVHNMTLGLQNYHSVMNAFPPGRNSLNGMEYSWCVELLPYIEQDVLSGRFNRSLPWSDPAGNLAVADAVIPIFRCPSSLIQFPGDIDYGGVCGSSLTSASWVGAFENGVLIELINPGDVPVRIADITDGTSQTICVSESADRPPNAGRWASGYNCFSHDNGAVNALHGGEMFSQHRTGAYVGFADGSTKYLAASADAVVVGALCTRNLGDLVDMSAY